ncbi:MAG TPA: DNA-processing protein DprA [Gammaproteobacteria bacterium]|nr:DNA-processing protein DprA [Gammaproteobacteria bacterium]
MAIDAWLTLLQAAQSGQRGWLDALKAHGSAHAVIAESARHLAAHGLDRDAIQRLKSPDERVLEQWRRWLDGSQRSLVGFGTEHYPKLLADLPDAPLALWLEGAHPELLHAPQLAMVGSRNPTSGGRDIAEQFARYLSEHGLTITSGLATGIDGASHRGALQEIGGTVAVLGSGVDITFPRVHEQLARQIAEKGLLVSEYAPGVAPRRFHFPQRNRIIAGITLGTLVVEATRHSGSLITARLAADYGREVFAIPGSIHNPLARGCHALIRQGAKLVEEAADIFVELAPLLQLDHVEKLASAQKKTTSSTLDDPAYESLLKKLDFAPTTIAELMDRAGLTTAELSSMLLVLELEGFVEALPGGRYSRLAKRV